MPVTLRDIAKQAGVSTATVSRVLNDKLDVKITEACRSRVLRIAEELGYRPNFHARALSAGKAPLIYLVVEHGKVHSYNLKAWALQRALSTLGRDVVAVDVANPATVQSAVSMLSQNRPEAVVFLTGEAEHGRLKLLTSELHARQIRCLIVDHVRPLADDVPADAVTADRAYGAYLVVSHLIQEGHTQIGLLTGTSASGQLRVEGYDRALQERQIRERSVSAEALNVDDTEIVAEVAWELLGRSPQLTALFCFTDWAAVAVMRMLHRRGVRVPDDIAVVGFDDEPWSKDLPVSLTTVAHPVEELCATAVNLLRDRLGGHNGPWQRIAVAPRLIIRESSSAEGAYVCEGGETERVAAGESCVS